MKKCPRLRITQHPVDAATVRKCHLILLSSVLPSPPLPFIPVLIVLVVRTLIPCILDMALSGLRALSVRMVLKACTPPAPSREAVKLINDTCAKKAAAKGRREREKKDFFFLGRFVSACVNLLWAAGGEGERKKKMGGEGRISTAGGATELEGGGGNGRKEEEECLPH